MMVFTSKKKFKECNDNSGVFMFVGDVIEFALMMERTDGIILKKIILRAIKE